MPLLCKNRQETSLFGGLRSYLVAWQAEEPGWSILHCRSAFLAPKYPETKTKITF